MGSSSNRHNWNFPDPRKVERDAQDEARTSAYEAEANAYLDDLLDEYNNRDVETVHRHLDVLQQAIEKDIVTVHEPATHTI